jgi:hypothetical protein
MKICLTLKLLSSGVYGCLVESPECVHAHPLGFSFLCRHPDHAGFRADVLGVLTGNEMRELYDSLRQKRRSIFLANLDDAGESRFLQTDFFGQSEDSVV